MSPPTIAISGASGTVGRHLCDHFRRRQWAVRALMRNPALYPFTEPGIERFAADLPHRVDDAAIRGADVVLHAAYTTRFHDMARARLVNEDGTVRLLERSRELGAPRFIFVSSLAARTDAPSYYARSKAALERLIDGPRDLIVRPGLVLARTGGLAHRLRRAIARWHVIPRFGGGAQIVQTVHVDDLSVAFERAIERGLAGALNVAEAEGLTMRAFMRLLAAAERAAAIELPIPVAPALAAVRLLERISPVNLPFSSENLLGLMGMRHVDTQGDVDRLGMRVRAAAEGVRTS